MVCTFPAILSVLTSYSWVKSLPGVDGKQLILLASDYPTRRKLHSFDSIRSMRNGFSSGLHYGVPFVSKPFRRRCLGHFNLIFCFSGWPFLRIGSVGRLVNENKFN